jgi:CheY-like chemotaxis protein
MLASHYLRDAGYRTLEAHNARQAIDLLEKGERVDVVFSDVQMPGMDGFELQRWLRQYRPRAKVLLSSGVENVKAASGYMGPPRWLIFKPYDMAELERRIHELYVVSKGKPPIAAPASRAPCPILPVHLHRSVNVHPLNVVARGNRRGVDVHRANHEASR